MDQQDSGKILISACLLGEPVRYDGKSNRLANQQLEAWQQQGKLLPICPEVCGGLATPRPPAEIIAGNKVQTELGIDVSLQFEKGAQHTLDLALKHNIKFAILTEKSPSCGSQKIYDGQFKRHLINGQGITTRLLEKHGIQVFNQHEIEKLKKLIALKFSLSDLVVEDVNIVTS
jgi:uncharacterized protein YbbK (DUF523 family)